MDYFADFDEQMELLGYSSFVKIDEAMSKHTTFHVGGPCSRFVQPDSMESMIDILDFLQRHNIPFCIIGRGSNILVGDFGIPGVVVETSGLKKMELLDDYTLFAEAGVSLARLSDFAAHNSLTGLEFAHGIPGSLGGGIVMNAGAYGSELKNIVETVLIYIPGKGVYPISNDDMHFSYRHSLITEYPEYVVLGSSLKLSPGKEELIRNSMKELMEKRKATQPLDSFSAGSTFKRPTGYYAGTLIEQSGLKGYSVGGAQVSEKHAGFVINTGTATAFDILQLMRDVNRIVYEKNNVRLVPEVKIMGLFEEK